MVVPRPNEHNPPSDRNDLSPRVRRVVDIMCDLMNSGRFKPGDKMPPLRQLARQLNLSYGVVNAAVQHLQAVGRLETQPGRGTFVASMSGEVTGGEVHLLLHRRLPGFAELIEPMIEAIQDAGMTLRPYVFDSNDRKVLPEVVDTWLTAAPRAVVIKGPHAPLLRAIAGRKMPAIRFIAIYSAPRRETSHWHCVQPDETEAYYLAGRYLLRQGYRRIGLTLGVTPSASGDPPVHVAMRPKVRGVQRALAEAGVDKGLRLHEKVIGADDPYQVGIDSQNVARMAAWLTSDDGPEAIIERFTRIGCVRLAAEEAGLRLGSDLPIVAVGEPSTSAQVEFPCVSECPHEVTRRVMALITSDDPTLTQTAHHIIVPPRFIPRKTFNRL